MKSLIILSVLAVIAISYTEALGGSCPLPSKVYSCSPKCVQDYECGSKVCCPNSCNAKSCVEPSSLGGGSGNDKHKYSSQKGGAGTYCNNEKCSSFEVCKMDPNTKRLKCLRP